MSDVLQDTLEIKHEGEVYLFGIPSFADEIKLGLREREIRRTLEREMFGPTYPAMGEPTGDNGTEFLVRTVAQFQHLLRRGPKWVYSDGPNGEPVIDFQKWDKTKVDTAIAVGVGYQAELRRFRDGGTANNNPAGQQAVAGQPDTSGEPVRPEPPQT